jgi:hypothetical protein
MKAAMTAIGGELSSVYGGNITNAIPVIGNAAAPVTAAIAEGGLNAMFIEKLGKSVIAQLQPPLNRS